MNDNNKQFRLMVALLIMVVLLPAISLLWFMQQSVENQKLASRQKLIDTCRQSVDNLLGRQDELWQKFVDDLTLEVLSYPNGKQDFYPSMPHVIYDSEGNMIWPKHDDVFAEDDEYFEELELAEHYEFVENDITAAMKEYAGIEQVSENIKIKQQARLGLIRCLQKAGRKEEAHKLAKESMELYPDVVDFKILRYELQEPAKDEHGNIIYAGVSCVEFNIFQDFIEGGQYTYSDAVLMLEWLHNGEKSDIMKDWLIGLRSTQNDQSDNLAKITVRRKDNTTVALFITKCGIEKWFAKTNIVHEIPNVLKFAITDATGAVLLKNGENLSNIVFQRPINDNLPGWKISFVLEDDLDSGSDWQIIKYYTLGLIVVAFVCIVGGVALENIYKQNKLNQLKNDFIATVTHELKTPLASTRMLIDTMLEGRVSDEQAGKEYLGIISSENKRLTRLIDNFLSFSRMERSKNAFKMTSMLPEEIMENCSDSICNRFSENDCDFEIAIDSNLPAINADPDAICTILNNLLDNAFKYTKEDKKIKLKVYSLNDSVCFEVSDNGIGMTKKEQARIFDKFYQADQALSRKAGGCGFGLSIVKFIADSHNAKIEVESESGEGSTFRILFKISEAI